MARTQPSKWKPNPLVVELFAHALVCASGKAGEMRWSDFYTLIEQALALEERAFEDLMAEVRTLADSQQRMDIFEFICDELEDSAECMELPKPDGRVVNSVLFCIPVCVSPFERIPSALDARTLDALRDILSEAAVIGHGFRFELMPSLYPLETVAAWSPAQVSKFNEAAARRLLADFDERAEMLALPAQNAPIAEPENFSAILSARTFCLLGIATMPGYDLDGLFPPILEDATANDGSAGFTADGESWADAFVAQLRDSLGLMAPLCLVAAPDGFYTDVPVGLDMTRNAGFAHQMEALADEMGSAFQPRLARIEPCGEGSLRAVADVGGGREEEFHWPLFKGEDLPECAEAFAEVLRSSGFKLVDAHVSDQPGRYLVH